MTDKYRLYVDYSEWRSGGDRLDTSDRWSERSDEHVEVHFKGIYRNINTDGAPYFYDSHEVAREVFEAEEVILLVVRYDTGDTFGRTYGAWHAEGICLPNAAERLAHSIENGSYEGYKPWEGYFEGYRGVELHTFKVEDDWA